MEHSESKPTLFGRHILSWRWHKQELTFSPLRLDQALALERAVNAHEALVAALRALSDRVGCLGHTGNADGCHCDSCHAYAVLMLAGEE